MTQPGQSIHQMTNQSIHQMTNKSITSDDKPQKTNSNKQDLDFVTTPTSTSSNQSTFRYGCGKQQFLTSTTNDRLCSLHSRVHNHNQGFIVFRGVCMAGLTTTKAL
ncbi:hypothetical protein BsWGS_18893 [Bradybaena similaris]